MKHISGSAAITTIRPHDMFAPQNCVPTKHSRPRPLPADFLPLLSDDFRHTLQYVSFCGRTRVSSKFNRTIAGNRIFLLKAAGHSSARAHHGLATRPRSRRAQRRHERVCANTCPRFFRGYTQEWG